MNRLCRDVPNTPSGKSLSVISKMADASDKRNISEISSGSLSSVSTLENETSLNEYSEDFHSSPHSNQDENGETTDTSPSISDIDEPPEDDLNAFVNRKLDILRKNRHLCATKPPNGSPRLEKYQELSPLWIEKLEMLKKNSKGFGNPKPKKLPPYKEDKLRKDSIGSEIACFQSAFERMKFENLRFKCRKFIDRDIHSPKTCPECEEEKQRVKESEFYKKCLRSVHQKDIQEKYENHLQTTSSALLIAEIIEEGPKPCCDSKELWDKLLSGGYHHGDHK